MKYKYKLMGDFNVSDEYRMRKLRNMANRGWILEDIVHGMFYKFRKEKPENIYYKVDYNTNADYRYFDKFNKLGWEKVVSLADTMHIFSNKKERKVSCSDSELEKHTLIKNVIVNQLKLLSIINLVLIGLMVASMFVFMPVSLLVGVIWIFAIARLVVKVVDYFLYKERIVMLKKYGICKDAVANNKTYFIFQVVFIIVILAGSIQEIYSNKMLGWLGIAIALFNILIAYTYYKNYKKELDKLAVKKK